MWTATLLFGLVLAVPGAPDHIRIADVGASATPFPLGDLTIACDFERRPGKAGAGSVPAGPERSPRFQIEIEDDFSETWTSGWRTLPSRGEHGRYTIGMRALYEPDTQAVRRAQLVVVTVVLEDGSGKVRRRSACYYRWRDGFFHAIPDYVREAEVREWARFASFLPVGAPEPEPTDFVPVNPDAVTGPAPSPVPEASYVVPTTTDLVESPITPVWVTSWSQLKAMYRPAGLPQPAVRATR